MDKFNFSVYDINNCVNDYLNQVNPKPIICENADKKECISDCIVYILKQINELETQISYYKEQLKGYEIGLDALEKLEKYEYDELKVYEIECINEQIEKYFKSLNRCKHLNVEVSNDRTYIYCNDCSNYIAPKYVSKDTFIKYIYEDWDTGGYEYEPTTYEEFYSDFKDEIELKTCKHRNQTKVEIIHDEYRYTIDCCVNCTQPLYYHTYSELDKVKNYVELRNKEIEE